MYIESFDVENKIQSEIGKLYVNDMDEEMQRTVIDKLLCHYTKSKILKYTGKHLNTSDFMSTIKAIDLLLIEGDVRSDFYNNYTQLIIKLIGKKQNSAITWREDSGEHKPVLRNVVTCNKIDTIITGKENDALDNIAEVYSLYNVNIEDLISEMNNGNRAYTKAC